MTDHALLPLWRFSIASSFPTVWIVGNTQQQNSSLRSQRGIDFPPGSPRTNLCSKSSGLKCTEHITECFDGCHFALFYLIKSNHFFLRLFASGRSSSNNGITWSDISWTSSFWLLQPAATQIVGISFARNRETTSEDKWNYVDFTEITGNRSWNWRH